MLQALVTSNSVAMQRHREATRNARTLQRKLENERQTTATLSKRLYDDRQQSEYFQRRCTNLHAKLQVRSH